MADSDTTDLKKVPEPSDSGMIGVQKDMQITLSIPDNYPNGGITTPIFQAYEHFVETSPDRLGSTPKFIFGLHQEAMQEKRRLEFKLQENENKISTLSLQISELKEKNAVLRTTLNAESRVKLMRNASITGGMAIVAFGFKLTEKNETLPYGIGLIVIGAVFAAFGWFSRTAKEIA